MLDRDLIHKSKSSLKHWAYYERNINLLSYYPKLHALSLFKSLKQLAPEEVTLLAERYYKSTDQTCYHDELADFRTVRPVPVDSIADKLNVDSKELTKQLKHLEIKVGQGIVKYYAETERQVSIDNIKKMKKLTLDPFSDANEIAILNKAFADIERYRKNREELLDPDEVFYESVRLKRIGI